MKNYNLLKPWLFLFFCFSSSGAIAQDAGRFAPEIRAFAREDATNPPPAGATMFLGSSSIRKWTSLAHDFGGHKVYNRGFGGSEISDSIHYFNQIVLPRQPGMIVFYAGSNDISGGKTPEQVAADFKTLLHLVETNLPNTTLAFISINASPSRWSQVGKVKKANKLISDEIALHKKATFIDTFQAMLNGESQPRPELYVADRLHMNAEGYAIWQAIIAPYLPPSL